MQLKLDHRSLANPLNIIVLVAVSAAAFGYLHWRRASLISQGREQVRAYLATELPSRYLRKHQGQADPAVLAQLRHVEVLEFSPSLFFRADRDNTVRVRVRVRSGTGATTTVYFRFKRTLGQWKLRSETHPRLFDFF